MPRLTDYPFPPRYSDPIHTSTHYGRHPFLERSKNIGPIFSVRYPQDFSVYIVDLEIGRRFLAENIQ